jgi:hypothetical protein
MPLRIVRDGQYVLELSVSGDWIRANEGLVSGYSSTENVLRKFVVVFFSRFVEDA